MVHTRGVEPGVKLSALVVATVLVSSLFGGTVGSVAAASGNTSGVSVSLEYAGNAASTNHDWSVTVDSSVDENLTHLKLDYSGTGTTFNSPSTSHVAVTVNGSSVPVETVTAEQSNQRLNVTFYSGSGPELTGDETIRVATMHRRVTNPATAGTHTAAIDLYNGTRVATASSQFQIKAETGTFSGTILNATSGSGLGGASLSVMDGQTLVDSAVTAPDGSYSVDVVPGTYDVSVSRTHFEGEYLQNVQVNDTEDKTLNVGLSPTGVAEGTIINASDGSKISGATVDLTATNGNEFYRNTTRSAGVYRETVANGTYDVEVTASGYVKETTTITVGVNETIGTDFALTPASTINGVVTNESGTALSGMTVIAWDQDADSSADSTQTGKNGAYSLDVGAGTYDVIAFDSSGTYEDAFEVGVSVSKGATVTRDVTMSKAPPKGTVSGTVVDPNGDPVSGATVRAVDDTFTHFNSTTTDANGDFTLAVAEGTYEVKVKTSSYPTEVASGVEINATTPATRSFQLSQAAYITGTVEKKGGGAIKGATVVAESGGSPVFGQTKASGKYKLAVSPDEEYRVTVWANQRNTAPKSVTPAAGNTVTADFTMAKTEIKHSSVEVLNPSGVQTNNIGLSAQVSGGMMMIQLLNKTSPSKGMPEELRGLGVGKDTKFRINLTVTNYDPTSLLWGAKNVTWTSSENESNPAATDISVTTKAVDLQGVNDKKTTIGPLMRKSPSDVQWPSGRNDRADLGWNKTVYFGIFDMATAPADLKDNFGGMTVTTNAQTFAPPRVVNDTLKVWVAGPHRTVDGNTHDGFYEATIPDAQLQEWGVDPANAKSELEVMYQGAEQNFQVTDLNDGVRIRLGINYSAGTVEVAPSSNAGSQSSSGSSSSGSSSPAPRLTTEVSVTNSGGTTTAEIDSVAVDDPLTIESQGVAAGGVEVRETTIAFSMGTNIDNEVAVRAATGPPSGVAGLSGASALSYLTVDIAGNLEGFDTGGTITFTVDGDRLADAGSTAADVQAYHYDADAGSWEAIDTRQVSGTTFEATTDSFSTFAVGLTGSSAQTATATAAPTETATPTATAAPTETATQTTEPTQTSTGTPPADGQSPTGTPTDAATPTPGANGPGFGLVAAALALFVLAGRAVRRDH